MLAAIIVTYNPDKDRLTKLMAALLPQVDAAVVVDNGSAAAAGKWIADIQDAKLVWLPLGENRGIAAAHNAGIGKARSIGASHVLLMDHDSIPAADMVGELQAALKLKQAEGVSVAAVGPKFDDVRHARTQPANADAIRPIPYLISSGSLIPLATFDAVGLMDERLFIDYVDIEWCWRAKTGGYHCFGIRGARMEHNLGDRTCRVLGRNIDLHGPIRHYYIFRNTTWLYRQKHMPLAWKLADGARFIPRFLIYALYATPRRAHITYMLKGIADGLRGRMGKLST